MQALVLAWALGCAPALEPPASLPPAPVEPATPATTEAPASPTEQPLPELEPEILHGRLANGLSYYVRSNQRPEARAELRLVVDVGSVLEEDDERGFAHLVEHMAFNGTERFPHDELVSFVESLGMRFGADLNAATTFDETVYGLTVPTDTPDALDQALEVLEDWSHAVVFDADEVAHERDVVLEEWRSGQGAGSRLRDRQLPVIFAGSRYAERLPIGDPESIEAATAEGLRAFYRRWYRPELMAVVVVGDFAPEAVVERIRDGFDGLWGAADGPPRPTVTIPPRSEPAVSTSTDPELTSTQVAVYSLHPPEPEATAADFRRSIVQVLAHSMMGQRLSEVARRPAAPFLWGRSSTVGLVRERAADVQLVGVREGEAASGLEALLQEIERAARHGFTDGELDRTRQDVLRLYEQAYEERDRRTSSSLVGDYVDHFLTGEPSPGIAIKLDLLRSFLPGITAREAQTALPRVPLTADDPGRDAPVILVSSPEQDASTLPADTALLAVFDRVQKTRLEPWVDETPDRPLLATSPRPGRVVETTEVPEIGVTEWRLDNGVRVVVKPTDFKNDEVLLAGFSPGGDSLASDEDYPSDRLAADLVELGGVADFDRDALSKVLAGTVAGAGAYISELEEGVRGSASPKDLETLFQLLYLRFTAPRKDPEALAALVERLRPSLERRLSDPGWAFEEEWLRRLTGDHPRRRPLTPEDLDAIDLDTAYDFYRDRFADAGDFTFVLVGNLDLERLEPLVETYLGALPASGRVESWRDVGVELPQEPLTFTVEQGLAPTTRVHLLFHGPAKWNETERRRISQLADVLRVRLRESLREEQGLTYGVSVSAGIANQPRETYRVEIGFECAPEMLDQALAALWDELHRLEREAPSADTVAKVQAADLRDRQTNLEQNAFWLQALRFYYRYDLDPRDVLDYENQVHAVKPEDLREAAERYLSEERYVLGVLKPAAGTAAAGAEPGPIRR
ncbi:MAG: insulinase family protein [Acidobacteria bacterium]|nr:insulinase family protein [Acidobacteriota bacterium]